MGRSAHSLSTSNAPTHHIFIVLLPVVVSNGAPFIVMKYVNVAFTWVGTTFKDQPGSCMITLYVNIQILKGILHPFSTSLVNRPSPPATFSILPWGRVWNHPLCGRLAVGGSSSVDGQPVQPISVFQNNWRHLLHHCIAISIALT